MAEHRVHGDLRLGGSLIFNKSFTDFPTSPRAGELVFKDGRPYAYTKLANNFYSWMPLAVKQSSYVHSQGAASSIWTITHNLGSEDYALFVYDTDHNLVMANHLPLDSNSIRVSLSEAITGSAVIFAVTDFAATNFSGTTIELGGLALTNSNGKLAVDGAALAYQADLDQIQVPVTSVAGRTGDVTLTAADVGAVSTMQRGIANGVATLDSSGKIPSSQVPSIAITDTFVVASQAAMLALTAEVGDVCVRTDVNRTFILKTAGASTLGNWEELHVPTASLTWSNITATPTTVSGYGITDAYTRSQVDALLTTQSPITNVNSATKLQTARTISLGGVLSGSATFDGSADVAITATLAANQIPYDITGMYFGRPDAGAIISKFVAGRAMMIPANFGSSKAVAVAPTGDVSGDADWASVVLAAHMDGANGGTTFTDMKGKTLTPTGSVVTSTAQKKFGTASGYFAGGYISAPDSADWAFGTGDFTIEFWVYYTSFVNYIGTIASRTDPLAPDQWHIGTQAAGQFVFFSNGAERLRGSGTGTPVTGSFSLNTWHHVAVTRQGGQLRGFVDGKLFQTATYADTLTGQSLRIGCWGAGNEPHPGYIDDIRITKGVARYTATFTPPTQAFADQGAAINLPVKKNGIQLGTISFAAGSTVGTFSSISATPLVVGDIVTVEAPATQDATLADVAFTIVTNC